MAKLRPEKDILTKPLISAIEDGQGKISNALTRLISYDRDPSLFDEKWITERDKFLRVQEIQEIRRIDANLSIDRRDKPVVLTPVQNRIICALSYVISKQQDKQILDKIKNPLDKSNVINRVLNITELSDLVFQNKKTESRQKILDELLKIEKIRQIIIIESESEKIRFTAPLIRIGETIENITPDNKGNDFAEISFGNIFFYKLNSRFGTLTPKVFKVWGKKGTNTELFGILLSNILHVQWGFRKAASEAETHIRNSKENKGLPKEKLEKIIKKAREEAMTYELNVASIKSKVTTDYDGTRKMRQTFWKNFEAAKQGLIEIGLIKDARPGKGAKGQEKISFILDENYNCTALAENNNE